MRVLVPFGATPTNVITRDEFKIPAESKETIQQALDLFGDQPQAELIVVHLSESETEAKEPLLDQIKTLGTDHAAGITAGLRRLEYTDDRTGAIRQGLIDIVEEQAIDVVVLDYEHRSITQQLLGSDTLAETLLEIQNTPVVFVPPTGND